MKDKEGMTLIEVMVALFIFVIMAISIFGAIQSINKTNQRAELKDSIKEELHLTVESLRAYELGETSGGLRAQLRKSTGSPNDRISGYKSTSQIIESFNSRYNKTIDGFDYEIRTSNNDVNPDLSGMVKVTVAKGGISYDAYIWLNSSK